MLCRVCLNWLFSTVAATSGFSKSRRDLNCLPINNSAGATPVVECGVIRYLNRNLASFSLTEPPCIWRKLCLKVWTALSAKPLLEG